jgi:hypothetical protein
VSRPSVSGGNGSALRRGRGVKLIGVIRIVEPFLLMSKNVRSQGDICQQFKVHQSLSSHDLNELLFIQLILFYTLEEGKTYFLCVSQAYVNKAVIITDTKSLTYQLWSVYNEVYE